MLRELGFLELSLDHAEEGVEDARQVKREIVEDGRRT
jgi:hypothetical protein